jgi:hypothetical protein
MRRAIAQTPWKDNSCCLLSIACQYCREALAILLGERKRNLKSVSEWDYQVTLRFRLPIQTGNGLLLGAETCSTQ